MTKEKLKNSPNEEESFNPYEGKPNQEELEKRRDQYIMKAFDDFMENTPSPVRPRLSEIKESALQEESSSIKAKLRNYKAFLEHNNGNKEKALQNLLSGIILSVRARIIEDHGISEFRDEHRSEVEDEYPFEKIEEIVKRRLPYINYKNKHANEIEELLSGYLRNQLKKEGEESKEHSLVENALDKSIARLTEIKNLLEEYKSTGIDEITLKTLNLEFTELWKFLYDENAIDGNVAEDIEKIKKLHLELSKKDQIRNAKQEMESGQGHYLEKASVNGIDFSVGWDNGYNDYTIYFPQIKFDEEMYEKGVSDQVLRISENRETAKRVFNFANQAAQQEKDVYKLYKKVENFINDLPEDEEG